MSEPTVVTEPVVEPGPLLAEAPGPSLDCCDPVVGPAVVDVDAVAVVVVAEERVGFDDVVLVLGTTVEVTWPVEPPLDRAADPTSGRSKLNPVVAM